MIVLQKDRIVTVKGEIVKMKVNDKMACGVAWVGYVYLYIYVIALT